MSKSKEEKELKNTESTTELVEKEEKQKKEDSVEESVDENEDSAEETEEVKEESDKAKEESDEAKVESDEAKVESDEVKEESDEVKEESDEVKEESDEKKNNKTPLIIGGVIILCILGFLLLNQDSNEQEVVIPSTSVTDEDYNIFEGEYTYFDNLLMPNYLEAILPEVQEIQVTEEYLEKELEYMVQYSTPSKVVSRKAKDGDIVNIDYAGFHNNEYFSGGSDENYDLTIGSGTFIDTFEEQLIGSAAGDEVDVYVTFPEEYNNDELKGQKVLFEVTVNAVKERIPNELTDEFVQAISETSTTVAEYREEFRLMLIEENENLRLNTLKSEAWEYLVSHIVIEKYDEEIIEKFETSIYNSYELEASMYGMTLTEYVLNMGYSEVTFAASVKDWAMDQYRQKAIVHNIIIMESMEISETQMLEGIDTILDMISMSDLDTAVENGYTLEDIEINVLMEFVLELVLEHATYY